MKVAGVKNVVPVHAGFSGGVAVVAENTWAALKGREALQPVWDQGPDAAFDSDSFMRELEQSLSQPGFPIRRQGDAQAALAASATKLEAIYEYPYQAHAPAGNHELHGGRAPGSCEIWVPTQAPEASQQEAAKLLGIPPKLCR